MDRVSKPPVPLQLRPVPALPARSFPHGLFPVETLPRTNARHGVHPRGSNPHLHDPGARLEQPHGLGGQLRLPGRQPPTEVPHLSQNSQF